MKLVKKSTIQPIKKSKIKKGDNVKIIAGKHKGTTSVVTKVLLEKSRLFLDGITMKKHQKPTQENKEGGIIDIPAGIHISNVMVIGPKAGKIDKNQLHTRIGYVFKDGKKIRISKKTGTPIS